MTRHPKAFCFRNNFSFQVGFHRD